MTTARTCCVHGADCPNEVANTLDPDAIGYVNVCWDGYSVLCDRSREHRDY